MWQLTSQISAPPLSREEHKQRLVASQGLAKPHALSTGGVACGIVGAALLAVAAAAVLLRHQRTRMVADDRHDPVRHCVGVGFRFKAVGLAQLAAHHLL